MKRVLKSLLVASFLMTVSQVAFSQQNVETTTTPPPAANEGSDEPSNSSETVSSDSSVANPEGAPAANAANEKPSIRYKLYSGKQRGNNVIYDPKK